MSTAVVLFNRDLRVHDHPGLVAAAEFERVIPLFVLDPSLRVPPNRAAFLGDCLRDLDASLTALGAPLVVRRGEPARIVAEYDADAVFSSADYTPFATRRRASLGDVIETPGVALVAPGVVQPGGGGAYKVFTPYYRRWLELADARPVHLAPKRLRGAALHGDAIPTAKASAPDVMPGGESAGRALLDALHARVLGYASGGHDDLAGDSTSRLSAYLHFGCVSANEVRARATRLGADGTALIRQLCWRDFYLQLLAEHPDLATRNLKPAGRTEWVDDPDALAAWKDGRTGVPIVDAGMRQLLAEGWMHNRARMVVASYLSKDLGIDWRHGYAHFMEHLIDADVANNAGNWQWTAGTGSDTRPNRKFNPYRQAERFDPRGEYVRRYLPEASTRLF